MRGAEYLCQDLFEELWTCLVGWLREQIAREKSSLGKWLEQHAPTWHQVGRVSFHLAENKKAASRPFAFLATYAPRVSRTGRVQYRPLKDALVEYAGTRNKSALLRLLTPVETAAEKSPLLRELLDSGDIYHPLAWSAGEAYRFLREAPLFEASGILLRLPDWWKKRVRPRVSVTIGGKKLSRLGVNEMLEFDVDIVLGGERLTQAELRRIMKAGEGLLFLKGQWVEVDAERLSQVLEHWRELEKQSGGEGISFVEGMRLLAGAPASLATDDAHVEEDREWAGVQAGEGLADTLHELRSPGKVKSVSVGNGFCGTLRPYQRQGHDWLWLLTKLGLGACLADDMGLGKTIQIIALLLSLEKEAKAKARAHVKPSLLVVPASLVANWKSELARFGSSLDCVFYHPSELPRAALEEIAENPRKALRGKNLVITSYAILLRQPWLAEYKWNLLILDEAQAIKNPSARQTRAVKQLKSHARIALTGTPLENSLADLWSLFDFLCPGLLGSVKRFQAFVKSLEDRERDRFAPLRKLVQPYLLRRLKTDKSIIADLPEKTEVKACCGLSKEQAALYQAGVRDLERDLKDIDPKKRRGLVLAYLMRFKQICNHPSHALQRDVYAPAASGKFKRLGEICDEIAARQEKVLVFTQFREMTRPLAEYLAGVFGREGLILHGGTPVKQRQKRVDSFQEDSGPPFFVLSLKAGGTGLNLTAASHVIHFDRWWNPAVENQATDRAFRIGQRKNVLVHKFLCLGTIEEQIDAIIEEKKGLVDDILVDGKKSPLTEVSDDELLKLVALDIDRACM